MDIDQQILLVRSNAITKVSPYINICIGTCGLEPYNINDELQEHCPPGCTGWFQTVQRPNQFAHTFLQVQATLSPCNEPDPFHWLGHMPPLPYSFLLLLHWPSMCSHFLCHLKGFTDQLGKSYPKLMCSPPIFLLNLVYHLVSFAYYQWHPPLKDGLVVNTIQYCIFI